NIPSELHIFNAGAHGFGVRESGLTISQWRELCLNWLGGLGFLDPASVRTYAKNFVQARDSSTTPLPRFSAAAKGADLAQAFASQRRVVRDAVAKGDEIVGYKGVYTTKASRSSVGLKQPVHGVLFKAGRLEASAKPTVALDAKRPLFVETEI